VVPEGFRSLSLVSTSFTGSIPLQTFVSSALALRACTGVSSFLRQSSDQATSRIVIVWFRIEKWHLVSSSLTICVWHLSSAARLSAQFPFPATVSAFHAMTISPSPIIGMLAKNKTRTNGLRPVAAAAHSIPPTLPPSVEEAYRRKCIQLKQRSNEIDEANDAARLRLARIKRQVEKLRVERAFLLEQLSKRTSTNVEDSEGSPSPPPTVCPRALR
jgi:hypothetical protein